MQDLELPESSPALAALGCLLMSVVGDPAQIKKALENGADIAHAISNMELTVVRLRSQAHDEKVRKDFALAEAWLRAFAARTVALEDL